MVTSVGDNAQINHAPFTTQGTTNTETYTDFHWHGARELIVLDVKEQEPRKQAHLLRQKTVNEAIQ